MSIIIVTANYTENVENFVVAYFFTNFTSAIKFDREIYQF